MNYNKCSTDFQLAVRYEGEADAALILGSLDFSSLGFGFRV